MSVSVFLECNAIHVPVQFHINTQVATICMNDALWRGASFGSNAHLWCDDCGACTISMRNFERELGCAIQLRLLMMANIGTGLAV
jgi:hypothetical protein